MTYRLICDSCTDLPPEVLQDPHITKVPLSIQVGAETVVDDESFRQKELLQKMRAWPDAPKTACPSPSTYLERLIEDGDNYIVTLSAALSGSYNAAAQALAIYREEGGRANVHVFNSRSAVSGQAQIALLVRDLAGAGLPFAQVVEQAEAYISRMQTLFVLENLDNLRKNGRLTKVQALVTGALRVKLLCGATRGGEIERLMERRLEDENSLNSLSITSRTAFHACSSSSPLTSSRKVSPFLMRKARSSSTLRPSAVFSLAVTVTRLLKSTQHCANSAQGRACTPKGFVT